MRSLVIIATAIGLAAVVCPDQIAGQDASGPPPLHIVMPGPDSVAPLGWKFSATVSDHSALMAGGVYPWVGADDPPLAASLSYGWRGPGATVMAGYLEYEFASRPPDVGRAGAANMQQLDNEPGLIGLGFTIRK